MGVMGIHIQWMYDGCNGCMYTYNGSINEAIVYCTCQSLKCVLSCDLDVSLKYEYHQF